MPDKLIAENPYRVLGVYVDTSVAEESRRVGRISAYAKVNRSIDIPLTGDRALGPVERTLSAIEEAKQALNLPKDRIRLALHWFAESSAPWTEHLNGAVNARIAGDRYGAFYHYEQLLFVPENLEAFERAASDGRATIERDDLLNEVLDVLQIDLTVVMRQIVAAPDVHRPLLTKLFTSKGPLGYHADIDNLRKSTGDDPNEMFDNLRERWAQIQGLLDLYGEVTGYGSKYLSHADEALRVLYAKAEQVLDDLECWCIVKIHKGDINTVSGKRSGFTLLSAKCMVNTVLAYVDQCADHFADHGLQTRELAALRSELDKSGQNLINNLDKAIKLRCGLLANIGTVVWLLFLIVLSFLLFS